MSETSILKCRKCGTETSSENKYCSSCGARLYNIGRLMAPRKFSIKLSIYSAILTFLLILLFSFFTAYFYTLYDQDIMSNPERLIIISIIGPVLGILTSTFFTSYLFTEIRLNETFTGSSVIIIIFKLSDFILASTITFEGAGVAMLSCLIAFAGSWSGIFLKKKLKFNKSVIN